MDYFRIFFRKALTTECSVGVSGCRVRHYRGVEISVEPPPFSVGVSKNVGVSRPPPQCRGVEIQCRGVEIPPSVSGCRNPDLSRILELDTPIVDSVHTAL